ncbi:MAG: hypothetical protein AB7G39_02790 [Alphaproteobacteria bacterium]
MELWVNIANAAFALCALVVSLFSLLASRRATRLAEAQEERRKPKLSVYMQDRYYKNGANGTYRRYAFHLLLRNTSDSDNALAEINLHLSYSTPSGMQMTVKIPADAGSHQDIGSPLLDVPIRIDAHQASLGWCFFHVEKALLQNAKIERYAVSLVDSHGVEVVAEAIIVPEHKNARETATEGDQRSR